VSTPILTHPQAPVSTLRIRAHPSSRHRAEADQDAGCAKLPSLPLASTFSSSSVAPPHRPSTANPIKRPKFRGPCDVSVHYASPCRLFFCPVVIILLIAHHSYRLDRLASTLSDTASFALAVAASLLLYTFAAPSSRYPVDFPSSSPSAPTCPSLSTIAQSSHKLLCRHFAFDNRRRSHSSIV
jgi:hypothetical protein